MCSRVASDRLHTTSDVQFLVSVLGMKLLCVTIVVVTMVHLRCGAIASTGDERRCNYAPGGGVSQERTDPCLLESPYLFWPREGEPHQGGGIRFHRRNQGSVLRQQRFV